LVISPAALRVLVLRLLKFIGAALDLYCSNEVLLPCQPCSLHHMANVRLKNSTLIWDLSDQATIIFGSTLMQCNSVLYICSVPLLSDCCSLRECYACIMKMFGETASAWQANQYDSYDHHSCFHFLWCCLLFLFSVLCHPMDFCVLLLQRK